jgi:hypothetical protein
MTPNDESKIHAVIFRSGEWMIAQCLEYDIATQARDINALLIEVQRILTAHIIVADREGFDDPFEGIPKAPKRFWQMYEDAVARLEPMRNLEIPTIKGPRPVLELRAA